MPTLLGPAWPPTFTGFPTRMAPEDLQIWQRWFPTIAQETLQLYFDVGLGDGRPPPEETPPELARMWLRNTQKRADVLIVRQNEVWLVELRFAAQPSAVGRVLTYALLWERDPVIRKPLVPWIVTNGAAFDPDVRDTAEAHGIRYAAV